MQQGFQQLKNEGSKGYKERKKGKKKTHKKQGERKKKEQIKLQQTLENDRGRTKEVDRTRNMIEQSMMISKSLDQIVDNT